MLGIYIDKAVATKCNGHMVMCEYIKSPELSLCQVKLQI